MSRAKLTRNQLAAFLPTPEAVRAFEQILNDVGITLPNELEAVSYTAENALAEAHSATEAVANLKQDTEVNAAVTSAQVSQLLDSLNSIAQSLALLATAPPKEDGINPFDNPTSEVQPPNVKQNADLGFFPMQWPTKNPRGNGSWADLWVPQQYTFVDKVLSLRNQSRDAGGTIYGLAAICCLDAAGTERGAFGYSRNSAIQPAGYTPDIVYVEFGDPFSGDANPSSFQLICTMAGSSAWFPGTTFVPLEHATKTGATTIRARGGSPISLTGGKVGIGSPGTVGEYCTVFTATDEYAYSWQKTSSKKWALGSFVGGAYWTNATDGRQHIQNLDTGETLIFGGGAEGMRIDTSKNAVFTGSITHADSTLIKTSVALSDNSGAAAGTLTNAPLAGNPTKWIAINDNGTIRRIPAW